MKNHHHGSHIHPVSVKAPLHSHEDIAQCAHDLWSERGQPENQDEAIWLEAERELIAGRKNAPDSLRLPISF